MQPPLQLFSTVVLYNSSRADQNLVLALTPALDMASCALSPALVHNLAIRRSPTLTPAAPHQTPTSTSGPRRSPQAPIRRGAPHRWPRRNQHPTSDGLDFQRFSEILRDFPKSRRKQTGRFPGKRFGRRPELRGRKTLRDFPGELSVPRLRSVV